MPSRSRLQPLARAVLRTQTDDRLVALARDGREAAFEEIVRRYRSGLVAFAAAYGPPDPEDVVQESFVRSWQALRDSTGEMHLKAWLYTIVRNRALNARRDTRIHQPLDDEIDGVRQPAEIVLSNEELRRVVAAVSALPETQREALVRSALDGHTHEQIAASIGSTPGAVRQLIYRARLTVRHGVGAVIPLPLVAALAELGAGGAAGAGVGAAGGGAAAAGAAGGASLATKAAVIAAIGVVAAGSGVAIERSHDAGGRTSAATVEQHGSRATTAEAPSSSTRSSSADSSSGPGRSTERPSGNGGSGGGTGNGGGSSGPGPGTAAGASGGPGPGPSSGDSGPSGSGSSGSGSSGSGSGGSAAGQSGPGESGSSGPGGSGSSGPGSGSSGSGSGESGSSGSGHSGSGSSGHGGGDDGAPVIEQVESDNGGSGDEVTTPEPDGGGGSAEPPELDSSGPGGSSGSGGGGSAFD